MSTKVGSLYYDLDLDDDSYNKKVDKASSKWDTFGSKLSNVGSKMLKTTGKAILGAATAAATGVAAITTASLASYADYEQLVGGVAKLFQDSSDTVIANAKQAYKTAGMSANAYMETVTGFSASLLQSVGGDTVKAANIADQAVQDMSDNANTFGTDIELIQNAYQGFAKGNFTMLDNLKLGYGGTATEMARLVNDSGVLENGMVATASNINSIGFDKYIEAIHKVQEEQHIAGTTAKEASSTISGSVNTMKGAWTNLLTSLGTGSNEAIQEAISNLSTSLGDVVSNLSVIVPTILEGLGSVIEQMATNLDLAIIVNAVIEQLPKIIQLAVTLIQTLVTGLIENLPMIMEAVMSIVNTLVFGIIDLLPQILNLGIQIIISLFTGISESLPELIPAIIDAVILMATTILDNLTLIIEAGLAIIVALIEGLVDAIPDLIQFIPTIIASIVKTIISVLPLLLTAALQIIIALAKGLIVYIPQLLSMIPQIIIAIVGGLVQGIKYIVSVGGDLVSGLWQGISNSLSWIKNKIRNWVGNVMSFIKGLFGISSPSKVMEQQVGFNLGAGIANGINNSVDLVQKAMGAVEDTVASSINPIIEPSLNAASLPQLQGGMQIAQLVDSDKGDTINQNINVNVDHLNTDQDLDALGYELGYRLNIQ